LKDTFDTQLRLYAGAPTPAGSFDTATSIGAIDAPLASDPAGMRRFCPIAGST
jgi:hypothetical protein